MRLFQATLLGVVVLFAGVDRAGAQVIFADDFDSGASPLWGNEIGSWTASDGVYFASLPNNNPITYSSLPFVLTDFAIDVDVNRVTDGRIWLRSSDNQNGVLLVTGGAGDGAAQIDYGGAGVYWHIARNGDYGPGLNHVPALFVPGQSDPHFRVEVVGDTYSAFVDNRLVSTLTTDAFSSGRIALYDFSGQTFDNVVLNGSVEPHPEPTPVQWRPDQGGNGHFYDCVIVPTGVTWLEAKQQAESLIFRNTPGHLLTVTSQDELNFVDAHLPHSPYWLGGFQHRSAPDYAEPGGGWRWITAEPWQFTAWFTPEFPGHDLEPNNAGGHEDFLSVEPSVLNNHYYLRWNDFPDSQRLSGFYVEYPVPEPSAFLLLSTAAQGLVLYARRWRRRAR